ncbi:hypothetical protein EVAR_101129_1 [Eumeta japonica]|uniref:Uncharacterized protein n=1 Tax=Eumeta variegata TaxID=151549 RepID=A0A4C2AE47_EUMVA|nr:hypothetical protein EVAR_101129_1 [Eumeta japonica]
MPYDTCKQSGCQGEMRLVRVSQLPHCLGCVVAFCYRVHSSRSHDYVQYDYGALLHFQDTVSEFRSTISINLKIDVIYIIHSEWLTSRIASALADLGYKPTHPGTRRRGTTASRRGLSRPTCRPCNALPY